MDIFSVAQIGIRYAHFMPIYSTPKMPLMLALEIMGFLVHRLFLVTLSVSMCGCYDPTIKADHVCNVYSSMEYDVEPDPRKLSITLRLCDEGNRQLAVSLTDNESGQGWVLIRENIQNVDIDENTKLSDLGISVRESEFREYTVTLPSYINAQEHMTTVERRGLPCKDIKDITLCFDN